ncbi:MAG: hypothetical protein PHE29_14155, partial [Tissierellia bacterium]|nr:hypothetical protein [Tissierellia bacterium]
ILLIVLAFGTYFYPVIEQKTASYIYWFQYTTGEGQEQHILNRNVDFASGNRLKDFAISSVAYVATPFPHSIFIRLLNGGTQQWGVIDDLIRFCNQLIYYCLLIYLFYNMRYLKTILKSLNKVQAIVIIAFLSYWPIYSFHLYGAVHQRLKLPFQIVVFLFAILIFQYKRKIAR